MVNKKHMTYISYYSPFIVIKLISKNYQIKKNVNFEKK